LVGDLRRRGGNGISYPTWLLHRSGWMPWDGKGGALMYVLYLSLCTVWTHILVESYKDLAGHVAPS
jgi:hypothetical protein